MIQANKFTVTSGSKIVAHLKENPSSGYTWKLKKTVGFQFPINILTFTPTTMRLRAKFKDALQRFRVVVFVEP
ncbi:MAG: hypothetical protein KAI39_11055 [Desulfobulbaceae bacterium]|nr:hypothetical protein [Desulfobulbaceae bacterium]